MGRILGYQRIGQDWPRPHVVTCSKCGRQSRLTTRLLQGEQHVCSACKPKRPARLACPDVSMAEYMAILSKYDQQQTGCAL